MSRKASSRKRRTAKGPPAKGSGASGSTGKGPAGKGAAPAKRPAETKPPATRPAAAKRPVAKGEPAASRVAEIPPRMVGIAYVLALLCLVTPLTVLGSGFAGAVLYTRGMRREGAGVIVASVVCVAVGFYIRTQ